MNYKRVLFVFAMCIGIMASAGLGGAGDAVDISLPENGGPASPPIKPWLGITGADPGRALIDDFNRADGPLGSDWTVQADTLQIISQQAHGGSARGTATHNTATGDVVDMDVATDGTANGQYAAAILNYGGGVSNILVKVQNNNAGLTQFDYAACYTGVVGDGPSFGLGFFSLSQPFSSAHMTVSVDAARTVTIDFTNIDGGAQPDQQYVCTGAPAAEGPAIGIGAWMSRSSIDNFGDTPVPVELQRFTVE